MAVRFRNDRKTWLATVETPAGRRSRSFPTEPEARAWEAKAKAGAAEDQQREAWIRSQSTGQSLGHLVDICEGLDWAGKDPSQWENACRLALIIGPATHPASLTMQALDGLVGELRSRGLSNTTIRKYLNAANVLLNRACRLGWIQAVPLMPEKRTLQLPEPRDLVLKEEWFAALLDEMERREQRISVALTLFLRQMGCRVGEALDLTWDRVDVSGRRIQFIKTKGNMPRTLPMNDDMLRIVKIMKQYGTSSVFPISYWTFLQHYSNAKHQACDNLGLSDTTRSEWVIHTLRHTRLTELARQGWQAPAIQQWAGHRSLSVTQRYIHAAGINLEAMADC